MKNIKIISIVAAVVLLLIFFGKGFDQEGYFSYSSRTRRLLLSELSQIIMPVPSYQNTPRPSLPPSALPPRPMVSPPMMQYMKCNHAADRNTCERITCFWMEEKEKDKCIGPDDLGCKQAMDKNTCNSKKCSWQLDSKCYLGGGISAPDNCRKNKKASDCKAPLCKWDPYYAGGFCGTTCYDLSVAQCKLRADCKLKDSCKAN